MSTEDCTIIRAQSDEDLKAVQQLTEYAFLPTSTIGTQDPKKTERIFEIFRENVTLLAKDDANRPMCMGTVISMTQCVNGKVLNMGGVSLVSSFPEARRKGYIRTVILKLFQHMKDEGMPVSTLYPFKESFYERLGYIGFPSWKTATILSQGLTPLLNRDFGGSVDRMLLTDETEAIYYELSRKLQPKVHGLALFTGDRRRKRNAFMEKHWMAVAKDNNNEVIGVMWYNIEEFQGKMSVKRFFYLNSQAKFLLLQWLARHSDQVTHIAIQLRLDEHVNSWLPDLKCTLSAPESPGHANAMGRVIDVAGLNGLPVHTRENLRIILTIQDSYCTWNQNRFLFSAKDGVLHVSTLVDAQDVTDSEEMSLSIQGLSGMVYGCIDPSDLSFRQFGNPSPSQIRLLTALFPPQSPFLNESF